MVTTPISNSSPGYWFFWRTHVANVNALGLKNKIKRINGDLDQLARKELGLKKLKTSDEDRSGTAQRRESSSLPDIEWPIIGRDDVKEKIIMLLTSNGVENNTRKLPVLPIVGIGGAGKTTLAQLVFHDDDVKRYFSLRIWIYVSQDFDAKRMLKSIIEHVYAERGGERKTCKSTSLESLHNETKELIEKRKILLVLDDAWNEEQQHWNDLLNPLKFGDNGSRVLVTTRSENVAKSIVGHMDPIDLGDMDSHSIWEILVRCAFDGVHNSVDEQLINIGKQIVEKLKGSPLAAKTIGRLLGTNIDKNHWKTILESDLWEVKGQKEHDIIPSLWLSYHYLPPVLKICFSLCSLFPKGYQISKEELSYLWTAHGIFQVGHGMRLENHALEAIQDLRSRSLLSQGKDDGFLTMHDLIHDISEFVAQEDHLHIHDEIKLEKRPNKLRHLSFSNVQWESKFPYGKLRSVVRIKMPSYFDGLYKLDHCVLDGWLNESTCLRVLNLHGCYINELPKSIGNLKHLRCLNLSDTGILELPKSLTSLYNLQALWLESCRRLRELPDGMGNLVNLRLLRADFYVKHTIKSIRRLSSLQVLRYFDVDLKYGSGIEELEKLDMLGGNLTIRWLENVVDPVNARKACLERKEYLQGLTLQWTGWNNTTSDRIGEEVLEALQPNGDGIEHLQIEGYKGQVLPRWLTRELQIKECPDIQSFADVALPASLQPLRIDASESYTPLPSEARRLRSLQRFTLSFCSKIESLVDIGLPASLQHLEITRCVSLVSLPSDMRGLTSLRTLWLLNCPRLQSFPESGLPPSLSGLYIKNCQGLQSFPESGLPPSLSTLEINNCPGLQSFPESGLPPSLSTLKINNCPGLQSFSESGFPPSLYYLSIRHCPALEEKYRSGPESALISHMPVIW